MIEVTEADRIAAKELISEWQAFTGDMTGDAEQAFATHRIEAAKAERDRLRELPDDVVAKAAKAGYVDEYTVKVIAIALADALESRP